MCEIITTRINHPDGTHSLEIRCKLTGKYVNVPTKYGIFCENMCGFEEAKKELEDTFNFCMGVFGDFENKVE